MTFNWHELASRDAPALDADPQLRLRMLLAAFAAMCAIVFGRLLTLEWSYGHAYRAAALEPAFRKQTTPAVRGRILARDGTVLAHDRPIVSLAVHYRWMEDPPNPRWLRQQTRAKLTAAQRRERDLLADAEADVLHQRDAMHRRLAEICGLTDEQWHQRTARIVRRVQSIADRVNADRAAEFAKRAEPNQVANDDTWWQQIQASVVDAVFTPDEPLPPPPVTLTEELTEHIVVEDLSVEVQAAIERESSELTGVSLVHGMRRDYPRGASAAHVVGYIARPDETEAANLGRAGIERQANSRLAGQPGLRQEVLDARSQVVSTNTLRPANAGADVTLTIDAQLQQTAEALLDRALQRRIYEGVGPSGGAIVAMDVRTGAILTAASAPRFDPNAFATRNNSQVKDYLDGSARPLFDRVTQMALPPGAVFKTIAAVALLESPGFDANEPFDCQGYLTHPDRERCFVFQRHGVGHGTVNLSAALAQDCNVYFLHFAGRLGTIPLLQWAERFGLGKPTGVDLPGEVAGRLPAADSDARALAIGQSMLIVTPLQMARVMAAVANGGRLVTPHVVQQTATVQPIADLHESTLTKVREGLSQVVTDPNGTLHDTLYTPDLSIAGKTGTAQTGVGRPDHAWFAGYAPANDPQVALVIVLEHAGDGIAAALVAKHLVRKLEDLGYLRSM